MTETELAWFTGIFEGEGCIVNDGANSVHIKIQMTDQDIIERVFSLAECGSIIICPDGRKKHFKPTYMWRVCNALDVKRLLTEMLPLFGERRKQRSLEALDRLEKNWSVINNSSRRCKIQPFGITEKQ